MSYGHADKLARGNQPPTEPASPADQSSKATPDTSGSTGVAPVPPGWYARPELAPVLIAHDFATLFRALGGIGISQRQIARLTGRSQSNISEIIHGRQVHSYHVLVALVTGLGIPPERMGVSWWGPDGKWYGPPHAYPGGVTLANLPKEVTAEMLRRHLIALGGVVLAGAPVEGIGELLDDLGTLDPVPVKLPSRLSTHHVVGVRDLTRRLAEAGHASVCDPQVLSDSAARMSQLLHLPGPDAMVRALQVAVAELRIEAGWAAFDAGLYRHALYHFAHAMELASEARDPYCQATALGYAGMATVEHGFPDDGLTLLQQAQVAAWSIPPDDQRAVIVGVSGRAAVEAGKLVEAAKALVRLGQFDSASTQFAKGRDLWTPARTDPFGDMDRPGARLELARGRLDIAEQFATASVRRWEGNLARRIESGIVLATIHITAGEQRGLQLAYDTVTAVTKLGSVRLRRQLVPLAEALEARSWPEARELARMARQVAA